MSPADTLTPPQSAASTLQELPTASSRTARQHAWRYLTRRRGSLNAAIIGHAVGAMGAAAAPFFIGRLIGMATSGETKTAIITVGAIALAVAVFAALAEFIARRFTVHTIEHAVAELRDEVVTSITKLPLAVVESVGTGALVSRTTRDASTLTRLSTGSLPMAITMLWTLAATLLAIPFAGGWVSVAFLIVVPGVYWVYARHLRRSRPAYVASARAEARADALLNETVDAAPVVDALGVGQTRQTKYTGALRTLYEAVCHIRRLRYILFPTPTTAVYAGTALCVMWGVWLYERGLASVDQVAAVTLYTVALGPVLTMLGFMLDEVQLAEVSLARLVGILGIPREGSATTRIPQGSDLRAVGVHFAYRADAPVLRDINLHIPTGQRVVVVGPSGSGKSTLARLFSGFATPTAGSATIGGVPVVDIASDELHQHVMLLTQEYHVFVGSLRHNLTLAKEHATDDELWAALDAIGASTWARLLPDGLDTEVSRGDHRLSPGHAQEVALARVLLANPPVVLLDEATSLLDSSAAADVEQAVEKALEGRTVLAIAHKLGVAERSDRVLVVDGGEVIEDGTHAELLAQGGQYARLWKLWASDRH